MANENKTGIGLLDLLFVMFIGLKLAHVIDWSWWLVASPFLAQFLLLVLIEIVRRGSK